MNRLLLGLSFIVGVLPCPQTFAVSLTSEDKIKSCMAAIYVSQNSFREKHLTFASRIEDLSLQRTPDCQGLKKTVRSAGNEKFIIEVQDKISAWTIDSSKTMEKIK